MNRRRAPHPLLRPFVREVWSCAAEPVGESQARIERLLPSGFMHLVLRLDESPVRLLRSPDDAQGDALANAVLAGARTAPYLKRLHARSASVGASSRRPPLTRSRSSRLRWLPLSSARPRSIAGT